MKTFLAIFDRLPDLKCFFFCQLEQCEVFKGYSGRPKEDWLEHKHFHGFLAS